MRSLKGEQNPDTATKVEAERENAKIIRGKGKRMRSLKGEQNPNQVT